MGWCATAAGASGGVAPLAGLVDWVHLLRASGAPRPLLLAGAVGAGATPGPEVLTGRPDAWTALEDRLVADDLWDAVGSPRARSGVVPVDPDALRSASSDLDDGAGVVTPASTSGVSSATAARSGSTAS